MLYADGPAEATRWADALWRAAEGFVGPGLEMSGRVLSAEGAECDVWDSFASFAKLQIRGAG